MKLPELARLGSVLLEREALAFYAVGGSATGAYVVLTSIIVHLETGVPDWVVSGLIYALAMPLVYFAHRLFSFRSDAPHRRAFSRYLVTQIMGLSVATILSFILFDLIHIWPLVASVLVAGLTAVFNFVILRNWAFAGDTPSKEAA